MSYVMESSDKNVYELACDRTELLYKRYDRVSVSFSGGKDSTVCLNVAIEVARAMNKLPVEAIFWDEEAIHPPTIDYMRRVYNDPRVNLTWICMPIKHRNACSKEHPFWYPWAPEDEEKWVMPMPAEATRSLPRFERKPVPACGDYVFPADQCKGTVAQILGLRTQESLRRYKSVTARRYYNWISPDYKGSHIYVAKTIYDWKTEDVWTAPAKFGWDYNTTYDVFTRAGISRHDQRVCPPFGEEPLRGLWQYGVCFPELWERMIHRVPGANTAAKYSRSPLYGYGDTRDEAPKGMSYREAIIEELKRWPESERHEINNRIKFEIRQHNKSTNNAPILDDAQFGLTWKFLYMIAKRGDTKNRKKVRMQSIQAILAERRAGALETRFEGA